MEGYNRERIDAAIRRSHRARSRAFTRVIGRAARAVLALLKSAVDRYAKHRLFRQNVADLKALDDRTLRDIGISRGDIAAIASKAVTIQRVNEEREQLARPALKLVAGTNSQAGAVSVLVGNAA